MGFDVRGWFEESWEGWLRPVSLIALVGALAGVYFLGWMGDAPFARLLVSLFAVGAAVVPALHAVRVATKPWARVAAGAIGLVVAVALVWPIWKVTAPGDPIAQGGFGDKQTIDVAATPSSGLTILVEDVSLLTDQAPDRRHNYRIDLRDDADHHETLRGELSRHQRTGRGRKGAVTRSEQVHAAAVHTIEWPSGAPVHLTIVGGGAQLLVQVFAGRVPWLLIIALLVVALLVGLYVDARGLPQETKTFVPHSAAIALLFLAMTYDAIDPLTPMRPVFGAALLSAVAGLLVGILLSWITRRALAPQATKVRAGGR